MINLPACEMAAAAAVPEIANLIDTANLPQIVNSVLFQKILFG